MGNDRRDSSGSNFSTHSTKSTPPSGRHGWNPIPEPSDSPFQPELSGGSLQDFRSSSRNASVPVSPGALSVHPPESSATPPTGGKGSSGRARRNSPNSGDRRSSRAKSAVRRESSGSSLSGIYEGIRKAGSAMANRMRHSRSGSEDNLVPLGKLGDSGEMDNVEEENEDDMMAMMASLERRQTTDPRALALQAMRRKSMKEGRSAAMAATFENNQETNKQRMVFMNAQDDEDFQEDLKHFASNRVRTAKYNIFNFAPLFLFEMFSRAAYFYFLCQACLSWWEVVSPLGGTGATMALVFVLGVSGIKAVAEDKKRHTEDRKTNVSLTHILADGGVKDVQWQDVKVGDIVAVYDDELIPADLLCLQTGSKDGVCYIKTTNLDGESNLKIRRPVQIDSGAFAAAMKEQSLRPLVGAQEQSPEPLLKMKGVLECEKPNADLHTLRGCFSVEADSQTQATVSAPVSMNEVLLRGCLLKNTGYVYGMVIYTGDETRIQQNAAKTPFKVGAYDTFLNLQIGILMGAQAILCVLGSILSTYWRDHEASKRYYLGTGEFIQGNYESSVLFGIVTLLTYWIILSYMVPISLFVTMEIVKFWQGFMFINSDPYMVEPSSCEGARCRNSNLMEDLGKVEYVFSDKTGTLTSNEMRLRQVAIKGVVYGSPEVHLEKHQGISWEKCMQIFDERLLPPMRWLQKKKMYADIINKGGSSQGLLQVSGSRSSLNSLSTSCSQSMENDHPGPWVPSKQDAMSSALPLHSKKAALPPIAASGSGQAPAPPQVMAALHQLEADILSTNEDGVVGLHHVDFWLNICICHSLLVETNPDGSKRYQGPSPDEVALIETARQLGFVFKSRDADSVHLDFQGVPLRFYLLNVIEFNSERQRMSVVARCPDGTVRLFCKGADATILKRLSPGQEAEFMDLTERQLRQFAQNGLRTLALATKVIPAGSYRDWDERFQAASSLMDGREEQMAQLQDEVERNLELVGVTAIEDKLQDGVPEAIATLLEGGIKVWMITGDKQETAINIATSCRLLKQAETAMICNSESYLSARLRLRELLDQVDPDNASQRHAMIGSPPGSLSAPPPGMDQPLLTPSQRTAGSKSSKRDFELVIDGQTLTHILGTNLEALLAELGSYCSGVVVCRASPSQKACIVKLMRDHELKLAVGSGTGLVAWKRKFDKRTAGKMLSIGDGANDVAMIQAADVGIGIMGKEGRQAVNNSDYAIAQFRFLVRLLLVHGQLSDYRISNLIVYSFYKNMCFATVLFSFQFFCGFSGQTLVDDITAAGFNVVFTSLPILFFSVFDRQMSDMSYITYPQIYNKQGFLNTMSFWRRGVLHGLLDGACCFIIPFMALNNTDARGTAGLYILGKTCFFSLLGTVTLEMAILTKFWTPLYTFAISASYGISWAFVALFPVLALAFGFPDPAQIGVSSTLFSSPGFFLTLLATNLSTLGFRLCVLLMKHSLSPTDADILAAREKLKDPWADLSWQVRHRLQGLGVHVHNRTAHGGGTSTPPSGNSATAGSPAPSPEQSHQNQLEMQATPSSNGKGSAAMLC